MTHPFQFQDSEIHNWIYAAVKEYKPSIRDPRCLIAIYREGHEEGGTLAPFTFDSNVAPNPRHGILDDTQPQSRALASGLRREKRFKNLVQMLR